MKLANNLEKIADCLGIQLTIVATLLIVYKIIKRKNDNLDYVIYAITGYMIVWRLFFTMKSSRYFSILILLSAFFISKNIVKNKKLFLIVPLIILYQFIKTFSSYNNSYILDTVDEIRYYENQTILVPEKEITRLSYKNDNVFNADENIHVKYNRFDDFQKSLAYVGMDEYLLYTCEKGKTGTQRMKGRIIGSKKTNKNNDRIILRLMSKENDDSKTGFTPVNNGDFEDIRKAETFKKEFAFMEKDGFTFYSEPDVYLPNHKVLFDTRHIDHKQYPRIFIDNQNSLNGTHSLHVIFYDWNDANRVYLLENFNVNNVLYSFDIKNLNNKPLQLKVLLREFDDKGKTHKYSIIKYIYINDNKTRSIQFYVDYDETKTSFYQLIITGENAEFIIDDMMYKKTLQ